MPAPSPSRKSAGPAIWLVKSEPEAYAWADLVRDGRTSWDGVRSYAARLHLNSMRRGDRVFFYESVTNKAVVGVAEVSKTAYPDPTADEEGWVSVELKAVEPLAQAVPLDTIKATPALKNIALLRQSRLSVMPVAPAEAAAILKLGGKK